MADACFNIVEPMRRAGQPDRIQSVRVHGSGIGCLSVLGKMRLGLGKAEVRCQGDIETKVRGQDIT
jgi:hypothetical protein